MSSKPFFKLFFSDLAGDTLHLSDAEFGSYMLLLGAMWNAGGRLPNDASRLARVGRCSPKVWARRWSILAPYFDEEGSDITSARMLRELQKVEHISEERSAAGRKGAAAKALKTIQPPQAKASANNKQPEPEPDRTTTPPRAEAGSDWPEGSARDHANLICQAAGTAYLDLARSPQLATTMGRVAAWKRDGASWEHDVLPVIVGRMATMRRPVTTWTYFDGAIADSIAANRAALKIPEHDDVQRSDTRRPVDGHESRKRGAVLFLAEQGDDPAEDRGG